MKPLPPSVMRTLGSLLALAVVLAVAISYLQNQTPGSGDAAATVGRLLPGLRTPEATSPPEIPYAVLGSHDASVGTRKRVSVEIVVNGPATAKQVDDALVRAAEALQEQHDDLAAIMIAAHKADARSDTGHRCVARLLWSPDGRGWDGTAQGDFGKHLFRDPPPLP